MALIRACSASKKRWKADSGGLRVDESKETEVQVLVGVSCSIPMPIRPLTYTLGRSVTFPTHSGNFCPV